MSIRRRDSSWIIHVRAGEREVRVQRQVSKAEAQRLESEIRACLLAGNDWDQGRDRPAPELTLGEAYDRMCREVWDHGRSERSYHGTTGRVAVEYIGRDVELSRVTTERLMEQVVAHDRAKGRSPRTINAKLAIIGAIMRRARDVWGLPIKVPNMKALRQRESPGRIRWLTHEEEERLIMVARQDMADLIVVLLDTGARLSEILNLEWRDVDLEGRRVHLWKTKADKPRTIPLTQRAASTLRSRERMVEPRPFVLTKGQVMREWRKIRKDLGKEEDPEFVVHMLRHTCASRLVQAGVPLTTVRDWLGHSSVTTTERYAHLAPDHMDAAVRALERAPKLLAVG